MSSQEEKERIVWALNEINHDLSDIFNQNKLHDKDFINYLKNYVLAENVNPGETFSYNTGTSQGRQPYQIDQIPYNKIQPNRNIHDGYIVNQIFGIDQKETLYNIGVVNQQTPAPPGITIKTWTDRNNNAWTMRVFGAGRYYGRELANNLALPDKSILLVDMNQGIVRDLKTGAPDATAYNLYLLYCALNDADSCPSKPNIFNAKKIVEQFALTGVKIHGISSFRPVATESVQGYPGNIDTSNIVNSNISSISYYDTATGYPFKKINQEWYLGNIQNNNNIGISRDARVANNKTSVMRNAGRTQSILNSPGLALEVFKKKSGDYYQILLACILYSLISDTTFPWYEVYFNNNTNTFDRILYDINTHYNFPGNPNGNTNLLRQHTFLLTGDFPCLAKAVDCGVNVIFKYNGLIYSFIKN